MLLFFSLPTQLGQARIGVKVKTRRFFVGPSLSHHHLLWGGAGPAKARQQLLLEPQTVLGLAYSQG